MYKNEYVFNEKSWIVIFDFFSLPVYYVLYFTKNDKLKIPHLLPLKKYIAESFKIEMFCTDLKA